MIQPGATLLTALCAAVLVVPAGQAQNPTGGMTIDQILAASIQASGGEAAIRKVTTRISKGTVDFGAMGISGSIEIYAKAPNKTVSMTNLQGMGQFQEGFDGTVAWSKNPMQGLREKSGQELDHVRLMAEFYRTLDAKKLFPKMELLPDESVNGKPAYVIRAYPLKSSPETWYVDKATYHLLRLHTEIDSPQGHLPVDVYPDDYRKIDGLVIPFKLHQTSGPTTVNITLTSIQHNIPIDDNLFAKPEN